MRHDRAVTRVRVVSPKVINPELFVISEPELADHGAQDHLRRFHIHLVENLCHLHDDLAVTKDDDCIGALIRDNFRVSNRDRSWCCIDRLR